jgi:hypothetical protein
VETLKSDKQYKPIKPRISMNPKQDKHKGNNPEHFTTQIAENQ